MEKRTHFTVIVAGENPEEMMAVYDINLKVEPYVVLYANKAAEYHEQYILSYQEMVNDTGITESQRNLFQNVLDLYKEEDDVDFYLDISDAYELDEETGNALSTVNPNGRYSTCRVGKNFSMPLINKDDEETFSCKKGEVRWEKVHLYNQKPYEVAWDCVMEGKKPENDDEKNIYENMKNRTQYFLSFKDRDTYVASNTAFWGYAFLSKKTGWVEISPDNDQMDWMMGFYDKFIKNLDDNTTITIYECTRF